MSSVKKIAVIDLGSNSIRMSVFGVLKNQKIKTLKNYRSMVRLSEGMGNNLLLCEEAMLRTIDAAREYKKIIDAEGIETVLAVATAAVRKAVNGADFVEEMYKKTGIRIEVIDGEREAYYDFLAIRSLGIEKGIICDIGGGSTELIYISGEKGELPKSISIPIGSRLICEKFFKDGESVRALNKAEEFFDTEMKKVDWLSSAENVPLIGIGGSLRAIAKFDMNDNSKKPISVHKVSRERMDEICGIISDATLEQRETFAGIGEERANIIMGGIVLLKCVNNVINPPMAIIADVGVREGVIVDFLKSE